MNYYTADLHFGYQKLIDKKERPFSSLEEMHELLIDNINRRTSENDVLIIGGDVACYGYDPVPLLKRIKCHKVLIKGNHDEHLLSFSSFRRCFADIRSSEIIRENKTKIFLSHYPHAEWDGLYKGIWHFYGHVHKSQQAGAMLMDLFYPTAVNIGVDKNDYEPKTAEELMQKRKATYKLPETTMDELIHNSVFFDIDDRAEHRLSYQGFSFINN